MLLAAGFAKKGRLVKKYSKGRRHTDDMELPTLGGPHCKAEQRRGLGVALRFESCERSRVTLDRLRTLALYRVELHRADHAVLLRRNTYKRKRATYYITSETSPQADPDRPRSAPEIKTSVLVNCLVKSSG